MTLWLSRGNRKFMILHGQWEHWNIRVPCCLFYCHLQGNRGAATANLMIILTITINSNRDGNNKSWPKKQPHEKERLSQGLAKWFHCITFSSPYYLGVKGGVYTVSKGIHVQKQMHTNTEALLAHSHGPFSCWRGLHWCGGAELLLVACLCH